MRAPRGLLRGTVGPHFVLIYQSVCLSSLRSGWLEKCHLQLGCTGDLPGGSQKPAMVPGGRFSELCPHTHRLPGTRKTSPRGTAWLEGTVDLPRPKILSSLAALTTPLKKDGLIISVAGSLGSTSPNPDVGLGVSWRGGIQG